MWAQIAANMSRSQEEPPQQADQTNQAASLQERDQQLAEIMEEEMTHQEQVSVLSWMHLQQAEEVKAWSQEIQYLSALVEQQQEAIEQLSTPKTPVGETRTTQSHSGSHWTKCRRKYLI